MYCMIVLPVAIKVLYVSCNMGGSVNEQQGSTNRPNKIAA